MGAHPYWYFVPHQRSVKKALRELREREFRAGRYSPVQPFLWFPLDPAAPGPGAQHPSIEAAMEDAAEEGTRSILDITDVGAEPDVCVAAPLPDEVLQTLYGTTRPTRAQVEANLDFLEDMERGHCVYLITYEHDAPAEILFAGYSFD